MEKNLLYVVLRKKYIVMMVAFFIASVMTMVNVRAQELIVDDTVTGTGLNQWDYSAGWALSDPSAGAYFETEHWTGDVNATIKIRFYATKIEVYGQYFKSLGILAFVMDDDTTTEVLVDCYKPEPIKKDSLLFSSGDLELGYHSVTMRTTGTKNPLGGDYYALDRVIIFGSETPPPDKVPEYQSTGIRVYPNPVKDYVTLDGLSRGARVTVINTKGQIISKNIAGSSKLEMNLENLESGLYLMKVEFDGKVQSSRFIKQ